MHKPSLAQGQKSTQAGKSAACIPVLSHGSEAGLIQRVWFAAERPPHLQPSSRLELLCTAGYLPGRAFRSEIGSGHLLNILYCQFIFYDPIFYHIMMLEFDRGGVPQFSGDPALFEEYVERARDYFYSRSMADKDAAPLALRGGLRGPAYDAVRNTPHSELVTTGSEKGMEAFLSALQTSLAREAPIRAAEVFDKVFYASTLWRKTSESMQDYTIRRDKEFAELQKISGDTKVSEDIKAHLLLRFSG